MPPTKAGNGSVTSFPGARGKCQVSNASGNQPRWRSDGKELFYLDPDGKDRGGAREGRSKLQFRSTGGALQGERQRASGSELVAYDVTRDGQRFLINTGVQGEVQPMSVVLNWRQT